LSCAEKYCQRRSGRGRKEVEEKEEEGEERTANDQTETTKRRTVTKLEVFMLVAESRVVVSEVSKEARGGRSSRLEERREGREALETCGRKTVSVRSRRTAEEDVPASAERYGE
jgi:hypothetical protein